MWIFPPSWGRQWTYNITSIAITKESLQWHNPENAKSFGFVWRKKELKLWALLLHSKSLQNFGKILSLETSAWIPNEIVAVLSRCFSYHHFHGGMIQNAPGRESTETLEKLAMMDSQMYMFQQP
jgi:hypothetical protein